MSEQKALLVQVFNFLHDSAYFYTSHLSLSPGTRCVVEHEGLHLGVIQNVLTPAGEISEHFERVVREATPADLDAFSRNLEDTREVLSTTRETIARQKLHMHLVAAEYTLDRSRLRIYFTAPYRIDFRTLVRELTRTYKATIELRQMGTRDEARIKGGIGRCGRIICCRQFLHEAQPVPMELAYDQELFVPPERITGVCGRLMCCLAFEHDLYKQELEKQPGLGTWVSYKGKKGKVISHNIFRRTITILARGEERLEVDVDAVERPTETQEP